MIDSHNIPLIASITHAEDWCIKQKKRVYIRNKGNEKLQQHSFKVVANMSFKSVLRMIEQNRLFECHNQRK